MWEELTYMTSMTKKKARQHARNLYKELGSIKKTARELNCSKAAAKRLLGKKWIAQQQFQRRLQPALEKAKRRPKPKRQSEVSNRIVDSDTQARKSLPLQHPSFDRSKQSGTIHSSTRKDQPIQNANSVVKTNQGYFEIVSSEAWGKGLIPVKPVVHQITVEDVCHAQLPENFPKIPSRLWARWINLCFYYCGRVHSSALEVSVLLCRNKGDMKHWKIVVPRQSVTSAHVRAEVGPSIDIETGEEYDIFPPPGWLHAGSSHSHNTMSAFFSGTDDRSELSVPGLHIVVGAISKTNNSYQQRASIVLRRLRKHVDFENVVDAIPVEDAPFHPKVLDYISTGYTGGWGWDYKSTKEPYSDWGSFWQQKRASNARKPSAMELLEDESDKPSINQILEKAADPEELADYFDDDIRERY
jgi:hypothetical protein